MAAFIHVAVIHAVYLDLILSGRKTIESRLSLTRRMPHGKAVAGERIYFKQRSGPVRCTALIDRVESYEDLTPELIRRIGERLNNRILGPDQYWLEKSTARYATLLWLVHPQAVLFGPDVPKFNGNAWIRVPGNRCVYPACFGEKTGIKA